MAYVSSTFFHQKIFAIIEMLVVLQFGDAIIMKRTLCIYRSPLMFTHTLRLNDDEIWTVNKDNLFYTESLKYSMQWWVELKISKLTFDTKYAKT